MNVSRFKIGTYHNKDLIALVPDVVEHIKTSDLKKVCLFIQDKGLMHKTSNERGEKLKKSVTQILRKIKNGIGDDKGKINTSPVLEIPPREKLRMTFKYKKQNEKPALLLNGSTIINNGELFCLGGPPGSGKSAITEAIVCAGLGGKHFGFEFNSHGKSILLIDTERPPDDVSNSYRNIYKRLGKPRVDKDGEIDRLIHLVLSEFGKVEQLKAILEREISTSEFELVILDGILDFSSGMNDDKDSTEVVKWVRSLAVKYNLAVVLTIHPNKGSETIAGHLGSFLYRWCRALLFVRSVKGNKSVKELTGEPEMSKLSHADLGTFTPIYFSWDESKKLLSECQYIPKQPRGREDKMKTAFESLLDGGKKLRYSELVRALVENGNAERTAKRWIKETTGVLLKKAGEIYSLIPKHELFD